MGMNLRSMSVVAVALGALLSGCGDRVDNSAAIPIQATSITALTCHLNLRSRTDLSNPDFSSFWAFVGEAMDASRNWHSETLTLTYTNFDWAAGTARLIGEGGTDSVKLVFENGLMSPSPQIIFTERTDSGSVMTASVFLEKLSENELKSMPELTNYNGESKNIVFIKGKQAFAVYSRHINIGVLRPAAVVSQYTGVCDILF